MKKIAKIVALMSIAAALFMSCKPSTDEPAASEPAGNTEATGGEETPKADVLSAKAIDFSKVDAALVGNNGYGDITVEDGKAVINAAGNYARLVYTPAAPLDLSGITKAKVRVMVSDDYSGNSTTKIMLVTDDTHQTELCFSEGNALVDFPKTSSIVETVTKGAAWSKDNSIEEADLSNVVKVEINPQDCSGKMTFAWIDFE